jgi:hypothetical protein
MDAKPSLTNTDTHTCKHVLPGSGGALDIFDQLLAGTFACSSCLSHVPLLSGYDEPRTLSYQIRLFGPMSADVRHYKLPFKDAVEWAEEYTHTPRRPGGQISEELLRLAMENKWIDTCNWIEYFEKVSPGMFLRLIPYIGFDERLEERSNSNLPNNQQVCWVIHLTLHECRSDRWMKGKIDALKLFPEGCWVGLAMFIATNFENTVIFSNSELVEKREAFLMEVLKKIEKTPLMEVISYLVPKESKASPICYKNISKFLDENADNCEDSPLLFEVANRLRDECTALSNTVSD